jgi:hypothetical protein
MNISLTAVGLLWNISDFLATEIKALRKQLAYAVLTRSLSALASSCELISSHWKQGSGGEGGRADPGLLADGLSHVQQVHARPLSHSSDVETDLLCRVSRLWLSTYHELKQLCIDARTEVRNCAIQTLFKTLSTHGSLLEHDIWPSVIAQVLYTPAHARTTRKRLS